MANLTKKIMLECVDGIHNKQWIGELYDDNTVITRWGKIGNDLQSKEFPNVGENFLLQKEKEKIRKGYVPM